MKTLKAIDEYLNVPEVAELKGVTRQAVWQAIKDGRLKAEKIGRDYIVHPDDANNWEPRISDGAEN